VLGSLTLQSCSNDDDFVNYPNALVTIKTNSSTGQVYFQLDDLTTIFPTAKIQVFSVKNHNPQTVIDRQG